jgi:hypothetical protein
VFAFCSGRCKSGQTFDPILYLDLELDFLPVGLAGYVARAEDDYITTYLQKILRQPAVSCQRTGRRVGVGERERIVVTYNENGNKASQRGVPVTVGRGLAHQHAVENEVSQTQFHTTCTKKKKINLKKN